MSVVFLKRLGIWTIILTLLFGIILLSSYLVTQDVEAGTLLYFYIVFAGFVNAIIFLLLLIFSLRFTGNKKELMITAAIIALSYLTLLTVTYSIF